MAINGITTTDDNGVNRVNNNQDLDGAVASGATIVLSGGSARLRATSANGLLATRTQIKVTADVTNGQDNNAVITYGVRENTTNRVIFREFSSILFAALNTRKNILISELSDSAVIEASNTRQLYVYTQTGATLRNASLLGINVLEIYAPPSVLFNVTVRDANFGYLNWQAGRLDFLGFDVENIQTAHAWLGAGNSGNNSSYHWNNRPSFDNTRIYFQHSNGEYFEGKTISWNFIDRDNGFPVDDVSVIFSSDLGTPGDLNTRGSFITNMMGRLAGTYDSQVRTNGANEERPTLYIVNAFSDQTGNDHSANNGNSYNIVNVVSSVEIKSFLHNAPDGHLRNNTLTLTEEIGQLAPDHTVDTYEDFVLVRDTRLTETNQTTINSYVITHTDDRLYDTAKLKWRDNNNYPLPDKDGNTVIFGSHNLYFAVEYTTDSTYNVGEYAVRGTTVYRNTTAVTMPELFNASKWTNIGTVPYVYDVTTDTIVAVVLDSYTGNIMTTGSVNASRITLNGGIVDADGDSFFIFDGVAIWSLFSDSEYTTAIANGTTNSWRFNIADYPVNTPIYARLTTPNGVRFEREFTIQQEGRNFLTIDNTVSFQEAVAIMNRFKFSANDDVIGTLDGEEVVTDNASRVASRATGFSTPGNVAGVIAPLTQQINQNEGILNTIQTQTDKLNTTLVEEGGSFVWTTASLINSPTSFKEVTNINVVTDQTHFTIAQGATNDDAYNGVVAFFTNNSGHASYAIISDYVGASKTITLAEAPVNFTLAGGETILITTVLNVDTSGVSSQVVNRLERSIDDGGLLSMIRESTRQLQYSDGGDVVATLDNELVTTDTNSRNASKAEVIDPYILRTTITAINNAEQTQFTIDTGPTNSDGINGFICVIVGGAEVGHATISDYLGGNRIVTLENPIQFSIAVGDSFRVLNTRASADVDLSTLTIPTAQQNADAVESTLTIPSASDIATAVDNELTIPTPTDTASAVRTELSTELGRIDENISDTKDANIVQVGGTDVTSVDDFKADVSNVGGGGGDGLSGNDRQTLIDIRDAVIVPTYRVIGIDTNRYSSNTNTNPIQLQSEFRENNVLFDPHQIVSIEIYPSFDDAMQSTNRISTATNISMVSVGLYEYDVARLETAGTYYERVRFVAVDGGNEEFVINSFSVVNTGTPRQVNPDTIGTATVEINTFNILGGTLSNKDVVVRVRMPRSSYIYSGTNVGIVIERSYNSTNGVISLTLTETDLLGQDAYYIISIDGTDYTRKVRVPAGVGTANIETLPRVF